MELNRQALFEAARAVRENAHAPFSGFLVGAAVQTADGRIVTGCNVEISSYSHTCCAERVAVFKAVSEGPTTVLACCVVTDTDPPATPCGACRQVLHDFGPDMVVMLADTERVHREVPLKQLLPEGFTAQQVLDHIHRRYSSTGSK